MSEPWSWKKFISGIFDGRNYAKSVIFLFCSAVILTICFSVYTVVKQRFGKQPVQQTEQIGTVNGPVTKSDSHDTHEKRGWQLFGGLIQVNN